MPVFLLSNPLKHYEWGSPYYIPQLLKMEPYPDKPVAEMWIGAHPADSSILSEVEGQPSLREYILNHPVEALGKAKNLYNGELPFLLKVLAAEKALSIQVHPSAEKAKEGFLQENKRGIPLDSPTRNYRDPHPKPELLCALTEFKALCGFRNPDQIVANFREVNLDKLFPSLSTLAQKQDEATLKNFTQEVLSVSGEKLNQTLRILEHSLNLNRNLPEDVVSAFYLIRKHFNKDAGLLAPLYLNTYTLNPGEALFLEPGVMHSYLNGAGIEIMANSDNVLRAGLTPKYKDIPEVLNTLVYKPYVQKVILPKNIDDTYFVYSVPVKEFELQSLHIMPGLNLKLPLHNMPVIILCYQGEVTIPEHQKILSPGKATFITSDIPELSLKGQGILWLATVPT